MSFQAHKFFFTEEAKEAKDVWKCKPGRTLFSLKSACVQVQCAFVTALIKMNVLIQPTRSLNVWVLAGIVAPTLVAGLMSPLVAVPEFGLRFLRPPLDSFPVIDFGFPDLNSDAGGGSL